ncbi:M28 family metallopeptidase [Planococcus shenhongbingii]|uniref:M28 family peptidase n=1 Tax=Planococcus shenhongbingii TaxID=3058398 RepID=A0ABT8NHU8_9BACL|nr:M28 family peptidase [Planococcus sp. N017]MDN7247025.1 M28 family peptidase [Planococcus sp. N017]
MEDKYLNLIKDLSDPALGGREPGSSGHKKAREMIVRHFEELKLEPLMEQGWGQRFPVTKVITGENLLASKKGNTQDWILLGAHYDHFKNIPGADDNAASIGIVFDVIASLAQISRNLTVVLGIFDLEEPPYFLSEKMGSVYFYNHLPKTLAFDHFKGAIVLDLCGHDIAIKGREHALFAIGADSSPLLSASIAEAAEKNANLSVYQILRRPRLHLSDHYIFDMHNQPHIFLSCGHWPHYHTPQDTFERLNLIKVAHVADFLKEALLRIEENLGKETALLKKFTREDELAEVGRLVGMEMPPVRSIDPILGVLMHTISRKKKSSLRKVQLMVKVLLKGL